MDTSSWPRAARAVVTAAGAIGVVALVWLIAIAAGFVDLGACRGDNESTCGYVLVALGVGALVVCSLAAVATGAVVAVGRTIAATRDLHRYGRWLTLQERRTPADSLAELAVEVEYHDATGGVLAGVPIVYEIVGIDPRLPEVESAVVVTNDAGVALIPLHVDRVPTIVTLHASVPSNAAVKDVGAVFVVGVGRDH